MLDRLARVLGPALGGSHQAWERHGSGDGYGEAMAGLFNSLRLAAETVRGAHAGDHAAAHHSLRDLQDAAAAAVGHVRDVRAAADRTQLAALDLDEALDRREAGEVYVTAMTVHLAADLDTDDGDGDGGGDGGGGDADGEVRPGARITNRLDVTLVDAAANPVVAWAGHHQPLALDGRTHQDLTAAARLIAEAYDRYLRRTWPQVALRITPGPEQTSEDL
ncbi:hypothetical protein ACSNOI_40975 [Actinomadura kijaniata]|uniref:hypothetical protein n=1 Tax=Actinomadura kijaniata TaxID=46161 RepID=UPI003F1ADE7A